MPASGGKSSSRKFGNVNSSGKKVRKVVTNKIKDEDVFLTRKERNMGGRIIKYSKKGLRKVKARRYK